MRSGIDVALTLTRPAEGRRHRCGRCEQSVCATCHAATHPCSDLEPRYLCGNANTSVQIDRTSLSLCVLVVVPKPSSSAAVRCCQSKPVHGTIHCNWDARYRYHYYYYYYYCCCCWPTPQPHTCDRQTSATR